MTSQKWSLLVMKYDLYDDNMLELCNEIMNHQPVELQT